MEDQKQALSELPATMDKLSFGAFSRSPLDVALDHCDASVFAKA